MTEYGIPESMDKYLGGGSYWGFFERLNHPHDMIINVRRWPEERRGRALAIAKEMVYRTEMLREDSGKPTLVVYDIRDRCDKNDQVSEFWRTLDKRDIK